MPLEKEVKFGAHVSPGPEGTSICTIVKHYNGVLSIVRIGVERNHNDAAQWGAGTIKMIRERGNELVHLPDATERGELAVSVPYDKAPPPYIYM